MLNVMDVFVMVFLGTLPRSTALRRAARKSKNAGNLNSFGPVD